MTQHLVYFILKTVFRLVIDYSNFDDPDRAWSLLVQIIVAQLNIRIKRKKLLIRIFIRTTKFIQLYLSILLKIKFNVC